MLKWLVCDKCKTTKREENLGFEKLNISLCFDTNTTQHKMNFVGTTSDNKIIATFWIPVAIYCRSNWIPVAFWTSCFVSTSFSQHQTTQDELRWIDSGQQNYCNIWDSFFELPKHRFLRVKRFKSYIFRSRWKRDQTLFGTI